MMYIDHLINCRFTYLLMITNLLYVDRDKNSLERVVYAKLSKFQEKLIPNKLTLNTKKANFVIFHPYQKKLDHAVILKIIHNYTYEFVPPPPTKRSSAFPLFVPSSCLPISLLYFKAVAILMHDVLMNLSPQNISNHFSSANVIHTYSRTFSSSSILYTKYSTLTHQIKSFS